MTAWEVRFHTVGKCEACGWGDCQAAIRKILKVKGLDYPQGF